MALWVWGHKVEGLLSSSSSSSESEEENIPLSVSTSREGEEGAEGGRIIPSARR